MKLNKLNLILLGSVMALLFTSCIKDAAPALDDRGTTFVKLLESPENQIFFEPFSDIKNVSLFSLRKDANSSAESNTATAVKVRLNPTLLSDYNAAHNETYELLPDSLYTLDPTIVKNGQIYTMTLTPGEFAKEFGIKLNGAKWDLSRKYALGFTIDDPGGKTIASGKEDVLVLISIKNKYDGIYSVVSGFVQRYVGPTTPEVGDLNGSLVGNPDAVLATVGPNTVEISNLRWANTNPLGIAGINNLRATVNPATNQVTMFALGNATLTNWTVHENKYDPATKTFHLAFYWNPTGNRREYKVELKYKGPR